MSDDKVLLIGSAAIGGALRRGGPFLLCLRSTLAQHFEMSVAFMVQVMVAYRATGSLANKL
jgi:hypothetical protein